MFLKCINENEIDFINFEFFNYLKSPRALSRGFAALKRSFSLKSQKINKINRWGRACPVHLLGRPRQ